MNDDQKLRVRIQALEDDVFRLWLCLLVVAILAIID